MVRAELWNFGRGGWVVGGGAGGEVFFFSFFPALTSGCISHIGAE